MYDVFCCSACQPVWRGLLLHVFKRALDSHFAGCFSACERATATTFATREVQLAAGTESVAGASLDSLTGGFRASGVFLLIAILLHTGLTGSAVVATDAIISVVMGLAQNNAVWQSRCTEPAAGLTGLLIGVCTIPGAFVARALLKRMSCRHTCLDYGNDGDHRCSYAALARGLNTRPAVRRS